MNWQKSLEVKNLSKNAEKYISFSVPTKKDDDNGKSSGNNHI